MLPSQGVTDKLNLAELIQARRNIKQFSDQAIDVETIAKWFEVASFAPNHKMVEPWKILMVGPETRAKLNHKANFGDAPVVFAILSKGANSTVDKEENLVATACFVQNFLLLAWEHGVGVRWASIGQTAVARDILGVPEEDSVVGVFGIGYPVTVPSVKSRTPIEEKITYLA